MSLKNQIHAYGEYLSIQAIEYQCAASQAVARNYALSFDEWRRREYPAYFREIERKREEAQRKRVAAFYELPMEQRLKAVAMLDMMAILHRYAHLRKEEEDELEELTRIAEGEEYGEGFFS